MMGKSEQQRRVISPVLAYFDEKRHRREEQDIQEKRFIISVQQLMREEDRDQAQWAERLRRRVRSLEPTHSQPRAACIPAEETLTRGPGHHLTPASVADEKQELTKPSMVRVGALQNTAVSREDDSRVMKISICSKVPLKGTRTGILEVHKKPVNIIDHGCSSDTTPCGFSFKHSFTPSTSASPLRERKATEKSGRGCQDTGPGSSLTPSQAAAKIGRLKSSMAEASDPGKVALEIARLYLSLFDYKSAVKNFRIAMRSFPERPRNKEFKARADSQRRKLMLLDERRRAAALALIKMKDEERQRQREKAQADRKRQAATGVYRCFLDLRQPVEAAQAARVRLGLCETKEERREVELEIHEAILQGGGDLIEPEATNQGAWLTESAGALPDLHATILKSLCNFRPSQPTAVDLPLQGPSTAAATPPGDAYGEEDRGMASGGMDACDPAPDTGGYEGSSSSSMDETQQREHLGVLGRILTRKRQLHASLQAFGEALRSGPEEASLRLRHSSRTPGRFLDIAQAEASPSIETGTRSRWQGGIEADEARRKALTDFTRFTGIHRGAQTLEVTAPTGGWANDASEIAYADRYSRREIAIVSAQEPSVLLGHEIPPEEATLP